MDGGSPILTATVSLIPFAFTLSNFITIWNAYMLSFILTLITLFTLGMYLGRIAKENILLYGLQTLAVGVITVIIAMLLGAI